MVNSSELEALVNDSKPKHVAIIMDGNGRWAEQRGKIRIKGHHEGVKSVRRVVSSALTIGVESLTLFAFSSENWRRPEAEVSMLMKLFMTVLTREVKKLHKNEIRLKIIGDTSAFSPAIQTKIADAEALTRHNTKLTLNIAANYGGQSDIAHAAKQIAIAVKTGEISVDQIDDNMLGQHIAMADQPAVDLMIRTGGDHRISNFLLWQLAYAELYFTDTLWPDFDNVAFEDAIVSFVNRERRFGGTGEQVRAILTQQK
ncbi:di-trans,poly-cis-decaprenylcistransferase [Moritella sp. 24]|uniref:polyprenyl diphosphate synthase n=1 Tax=Moritella sp. 24 TaxID=2746230 RepID=UPI001BA6BD19|nr:polyprenyl diphosphate synthase [Moritella sp. 24]QUM77955.1 di-trans,poly-cis-decaprenylcistransferase [Moritella sp. 24]